MDTLRHDLKLAWRTLRAHPGFTTLAVLCLGIGIGANTAMFSPVDVFMLRPLPYDEPDELLVTWVTNAERGWEEVSHSVPDFLDYRAQSRTVDVAAYTGRSFNLAGDGAPERLSGTAVSYNFFRVFRETPVLGRGFVAEDEEPGAPKVLVLSHGLWVRRFGADPGVVGTTLRLDGEPHTVVGVGPERFTFPGDDSQMWTALQLDPAENRSWHYLPTVGRLAAGTTVDQARAELSAIAAGLAERYPDTNAGNGIAVMPLWEELFGQGFREGSAIATAAVMALLLIAAANVANLLLARATGRERELAVRAALGAGRWRIARQLLTESVVLGALGGVAGLLLAYPMVRGLIALFPPDLPRIDEMGLDLRILAYGLVVTLFAGVVAGLAPALHAARQDVNATLQEGGRSGTSGRRGARLRNGMVAAEVALAMVLLVSSALLVKGFLRVRNADLGYDPGNVLTLRVDLPEADYAEDGDLLRFHDVLLERVAALPGVHSAAITHRLPRTGNSATYYHPEEQSPDEGQWPVVSYRTVSAGWFETLGIPLVRGRPFGDADRGDGERVVVVNEAFAARHWPEGDALGRRVVLTSSTLTVVGIVGDARENDVDGPVASPMIYTAAAQVPPRELGLALKTSGDPLALAGPVRSVVLAIDPNLPTFDVMALERRIADSLQTDGIMAKIMLMLGGIALLLAVIGVYGVMSYSVSQRTQEIGIRMALGAADRQVVGMVVRQGARTVLVGAGVGLLLAFAASRGLSFFLFGLSPNDPAVFLSVALALLFAAFAATYVPARRATAVDPLIALRAE
jgi:putative ABC transport system permease protein